MDIVTYGYSIAGSHAKSRTETMHRLLKSSTYLVGSHATSKTGSIKEVVTYKKPTPKEVISLKKQHQGN